MTSLARAAAWAIRRYQRAGGGRRLFLLACDFEPSCSEYTRHAIERFGLLQGLRFGLARIRRCDGRHGLRPVPDRVPEAWTEQPRARLAASAGRVAALEPAGAPQQQEQPRDQHHKKE